MWSAVGTEVVGRRSVVLATLIVAANVVRSLAGKLFSDPATQDHFRGAAVLAAIGLEVVLLATLAHAVRKKLSLSAESRC